MKKTGFGLEHGDVPAGLFVEDAKVDVGHGGIAALWRDYRNARWAITEAIGRSSNIEAEVSELVVEQLHGGYRLKESSKSTDVVTPEGLRIQVKSRVLRQGDVTKLGTIHPGHRPILRGWRGLLCRGDKLRGGKGARALGRAGKWLFDFDYQGAQVRFQDEGSKWGVPAHRRLSVTGQIKRLTRAEA